MNSSSDSGEKKGYAEGFWSTDMVKEVFLDEQRQYMWNMDYWRNVVVPLFGLKEDSTILDVGCGMGFIGRSLAEFLPQGKVIGVDSDPKLVEAAKQVVAKSSFKTAFDFRVGDALSLPIDDASVDLSICQCLLMHLEEPIKAILEMRRVTREGGRVVVMEPDYLGISFFDSAFEEMNYSLEDRVKMRRWEMLIDTGKKKMGMGDNTIGAKVPNLFFESGLRLVDVRAFDRVFWLVPPYKQEGNELELKHLMMPPESWIESLDIESQFMNGGGTEEEWKQYVNLLKKEHEIRLGQIQEKKIMSIQHTTLIITIGEKTR